jgi:hypothetical protein
LLKISDASIQAVLASEREEAVVPVEVDGSIVDRVDDDGTRAELSRAGDRPDEGVAQQVGAEPCPMFLAMERELGDEQYWHRVGLSTTKSRRSDLVTHAAHRQRVVAGDPACATQHPGGGSAGGGGHGRRANQPVVELSHAAVEIVALMPGQVEKLDGAETRSAQALGIWLLRLNSFASSGTASAGLSISVTNRLKSAAESSMWLARSSKSWACSTAADRTNPVTV